MAGYVRQDTSNNISNGNVIDADDLDAEFDAIVGAFNASTGHAHDGTVGNGPPIVNLGPAQEITVTSSAVLPDADDSIDLGSSLLEFKDLYIDGVAYVDSLSADAVTVSGNISVSGTVDGRDVAADGTKLDGIETGAEVNTVASVNTKTGAVVLDADDISDSSTTNKFTTASDISKLAGIEAGATADQTGAEIKSLYEAEANTNAYTDSEKTLVSTLSGVTGDVVGTTNTQTLTNKTLTSPTVTSPTISGAILNDGYTEEVYAVSGTTPALSPTNGSIQTWTLSGSSTPTAGTWAAGQSITLLIDDGTAYTVTWTSLPVVWKTEQGFAPTLNTSGDTVILLWKVGTTIYGARVGNA
jgi:hypothetical protein